MSNKECLDYREAGFRLIRLHGISESGVCDCDEAEACDMVGKHPFTTGWQNTPHMDDEQFNNMVEFGWLDQYGILIDSHLVVDIDPRNGGDASYKRLCDDLDLDLMSEAGHYVKTGGGGHHIFFKNPDGFPLLSKLDKYPGIDFKTNGFVVGAGSMHKSGKRYKIVDGCPQDAADAPSSLLSLLKRSSDMHRVTLNNESISVDEAEIKKMLEFIPPNDYETMVAVGMGLHHATNGVGIDLWDDWCKKSEKYDGYSRKQKKWHSFGKRDNPITVASVYKIAEQHGYIPSVTFEASEIIKRQLAEIDDMDAQNVKDFDKKEKQHGDDDTVINPTSPINYKAIERLTPPGMVGEIATYIKEQNMRPRDWVSVMAALSLVGNIGGLRYKDDLSGVTPNAFFMGVADSGTSKNSIIETSIDLYRRLGLADAVNGRIKSEQELVRNMMFHQANYYLVDEFGKFLGKLSKAGNATAHYLDGITGVLMDAYSKAESYFLLSGDQKRDYKNDLVKQYSQVKKRVENDEYKDDSERIRDAIKCEEWRKMLEDASNGIRKPFLSLCTFTTSLGFDDFFSKETVLDGFMGRCIIFSEQESAPRMNALKNRREWPLHIVTSMMQIYSGGTYERTFDARVEYTGERKTVTTDQAAKTLLSRVSNFFNDLAVYYSKTNGFEALALRGYEAVSKVSLILSIPSEVRTVEHVEYAFAVVMHDLEHKINLVTQNETSEAKGNDEKVDHFVARVLSLLASGEMPLSILKRKLGSGKQKMQAADIEPFLAAMVERKYIERTEIKGKGVKYRKS